MKKGDEVLVYIGGDAPASRAFYARAKIGSIEPVHRSGDYKPTDMEGHSPAIAWLILQEITLLQPRVPAREVLSRLSFVPANLKYWGASFTAGVRMLKDADWEVIVGNRGLEPYCDGSGAS